MITLPLRWSSRPAPEPQRAPPDQLPSEVSRPFRLYYVALFVFATLMVAAAYGDFARRLIPNLVVASLCALWPLYLLTAPRTVRAWPASRWLEACCALACALIVFLAGTICFSRGYFGGGDVKLMTVAVLWAGPVRAPALLAVTGILAGAAITLSGSWIGLPLGIAIAGAALIVILLPAVKSPRAGV